MTTERTPGEPPRHGHLDERSRDPMVSWRRVRAGCSDVGEFTLAARDVVPAVKYCPTHALSIEED